MKTIPMWIFQALVGLLLTSGATWATWASVTAWKHDGRIAVVETKVESVKDDVREIKDTNKEINHKLDRILERMPRGR